MNPLYQRRVMMASNGNAIPDGCEIVVFEVAEAALTVTVAHSLGVIPKVAFCIGVYNSDYDDYPDYSLVSEIIGADPATGQFDVAASTANKIDVVQSYNPDNNVYYATTTYTTYPASMTAQNVTFATGRYYNARFNPGVKFIAVLVK